MIDDNAMRHRMLSAYVDGRIDKLHVNFIGAEVTEGQPLAEFYSPTLLQAEREYRQLGGELQEKHRAPAPPDGTHARSRSTRSIKSPPTRSPRRFYHPSAAPSSRRSIYEGQYVATGQQLFEIADFSTMWFMFRAYEQDMPWIKPGQTVDGHHPLDSRTKPSSEKSPSSIRTSTKPPAPPRCASNWPTRSSTAAASCSTASMPTAMVELEAPAVLTVPRSAVIETGPEAVVYIDQDGGAYAAHRSSRPAAAATRWSRFYQD